MSASLEGSRLNQEGIEWLDADCSFQPIDDDAKEEPPPQEGRIARAHVRRSRLRVSIAVLAALSAAAMLVLTLIGPMIQNSRKDRCQAQFKRIGEALRAYEAAHNYYPAAAITDASGRPLLSWRVAILPQLGLASLYEQFHRGEPWDSAHNLALLPRIPDVYRCPSLSDAPDFATGYQVAVGPKPELGSIGTLFEWSRGIEIREVIDGTTNTVAVFETRRTIPWTQPDDPRFDRDSPLPDFASGHPGGFHAVFGDGTTRFLRATTVPQTLRAVLTRDGNEVLEAG